jgi:hypothetical protein
LPRRAGQQNRLIRVKTRHGFHITGQHNPAVLPIYVIGIGNAYAFAKPRIYRNDRQPSFPEPLPDGLLQGCVTGQDNQGRARGFGCTMHGWGTKAGRHEHVDIPGRCDCLRRHYADLKAPINLQFIAQSYDRIVDILDQCATHPNRGRAL